MLNKTSQILLCSILTLGMHIFPKIASADNIRIEFTEDDSYSIEVARIEVGDTINWLPINKGHNVEFIKGGVPDGVDKFRSKYNVDTEYKFTIPGIYAYWCTPHKNMGMIGFVVVDGDKSNLEQIKKIRFNAKSKKMMLIF